MAVVYRLACIRCDRDDYDEVLLLPDDWVDTGEAVDTGSKSQWWTHVGLCPDCRALAHSREEV